MICEKDDAFMLVYLGLGTNLGNKEENIKLALGKIKKQIGNINSQSAFYVSEPFGFESDNQFINCVVEVTTCLSPFELLRKSQSIEKQMGRLQKTDYQGYTDRVIDIDILFYNQKYINTPPELVIPHPRMQERYFVLKPLADIAPNFVHPVFNKTIKQLLSEL